jgi:F-type H+-transporting ATPase subunit delta
MAEPVTVARPYAEAAFSIAREANALPVWGEMLKLASNVAADARMHSALDNPKLSAAEKESLFLSVCGEGLNADARSFIRVLVEAERIVLLPEIRKLFDALKDEADGVARAHITSAFPMSDAELAAMKTSLEKRFGKKIETTVGVDPELIGGATIVVGDTVIDGSVRGELQSMATHLRT